MSLKLNGANIWITSDTHYGHAGICKSTTHWRILDENGEKVIPEDSVRDFASLSDMNDAIVENINQTVGEDDVLFHLGDWSFGGIQNIEELRYRIKCKNIHLILGNHDHHIESNTGNVRKYFSSVNHYLEVSVGTTSKNLKLILCHYPISSWNHLRRNGYMLHGHQHLRGDKRFGNGKRMDVGMCGSPEFRPYNLGEVVDLLKDAESYEIESRTSGINLIR
jgi:calcineurin-like phosphoesterase family protein